MTSRTSARDNPNMQLKSQFANFVLPEFVSNWKLKHINKLNIYYEQKYLETPQEVLLKKGKVKELTDIEKKYISLLQSYLHFDAVYEKNADKVSYAAFYSSFMKPLLGKIIKTVRSSEELNKREETGQDNHIIEKVKTFVDDFVNELSIYLMKTQDPNTNISDETYSSLFRSFATMCHLRPRNGNDDPSLMRGLMGVNVKSCPDYRLCKKGILYRKNEEINSLVSVVKLKKRDKQNEHGQSSIKRRKTDDSTSSNDSYSDSSSTRSSNSSISCSSDDKRNNVLDNTCSTNSSMSCSSDDKRKDISELEQDLGCTVLGQHAGELLLDISKYKSSTIKIPGMIVNGTKVYFTLLDISGAHYVKIIRNENLDEEKATVFYSRPLDILIEEQRNILIESFMRLNNIDT